ncbi:hypothetical protein J6590_044051 [Homalodisca vitripennis]|nr:hypothetical protein J6590_044051 [Homalodisca vitripennis]
MIVELLLLALLLLVLRLFVFKSKAQRMYDKFPGPRSYPIIGSLLEFDYPNVEVTETFKQLSYKYGPVYMIRMGLDPVICVRSPQDFEAILGSTTIIDKAPSIYWILYSWLNRGLLTSEASITMESDAVETSGDEMEKPSSECDQNISLVNKKSTVETPEEWNHVFMTARSNPSPFKIIPVQQHMIHDWTTFLKEQYKEKCPFATRPIRGAKMLKDETELFYRPTYNGPWFSSDIRRPCSNITLSHLQPGEFLYPDQVYQAFLPISKEKFDDLQNGSELRSLISRMFRVCRNGSALPPLRGF